MLTASHFVRAPLRRRLLAIGVLVAVAAVGSYAQRPASLRYDQLAVGSADSALIFDGDKTVGIDTGSTGGAMINRLLAEGRDLDALILTHLHGDHAGGVQAILDADIKIDQVYLPVDYEKQGYSEETLAVIGRLIDGGIPVTCLAAGDTLRFHETTIDVLWPQRNGTREGIDANDRSLAMLIALGGGVRILSMGDNGSLYERYAARPADVLKVGHHGSKSGTGEPFLDIVEPTLAIITVKGNGNSPAQATIDRLQAAQAQVLRTDETGELTIIPTQNGYRTYRYLSEDAN